MSAQREREAWSLVTLRIPVKLVPHLIGKGGKRIESIKSSTGTRIFIRPDPLEQDFQNCDVKGPPHRVDEAVVTINDFINSLLERDQREEAKLRGKSSKQGLTNNDNAGRGYDKGNRHDSGVVLESDSNEEPDPVDSDSKDYLGMTLSPPHKCDACGKVFDNLDQFDKHKRQFCVVRQGSATSRQQRNDGAPLVAQKKSPISTCGICGLLCYKKGDLKRHRKFFHKTTHPSSKQTQTVPMPSLSLLQDDATTIRQQQNDGVPVAQKPPHPLSQCGICGLLRYKKGDLKRHRKNSHECKLTFSNQKESGVTALTTLQNCWFCIEKFPSEAKLFEHMIKIHYCPATPNDKMQQEPTKKPAFRIKLQREQVTPKIKNYAKVLSNPRLRPARKKKTSRVIPLHKGLPPMCPIPNCNRKFFGLESKLERHMEIEHQNMERRSNKRLETQEQVEDSAQPISSKSKERRRSYGKNFGITFRNIDVETHGCSSSGGDCGIMVLEPNKRKLSTVIPQMPFQCLYCRNHSSTSRFDHERHLRQVHSIEFARYKCSVCVCSQFFVNYAELLLHWRRHRCSKLNPWVCTECNKTFTSSHNFFQHRHHTNSAVRGPIVKATGKGRYNNKNRTPHRQNVRAIRSLWYSDKDLLVATETLSIRIVRHVLEIGPGRVQH